MDVRLDGADRHAGDARDLLVGEAEGVPEHDRHALVEREAGEPLEELPPDVAEDREAGRIRVLPGRLLGEIELFRPAETLSGAQVPAGVHNEPVEPGGELGVPAELAQPGAELLERLLGGVAGVLEVEHEVLREPLHAGRVALDQRVERMPVPAVRLGHEIHVAERAVGNPPLDAQTRRGGGRLHDRVSLVRPMDLLTPDRIEPLLAGAFGRPYFYEDSCESTQRLLAGSLPEGAVAVCDVQTAGRGRLGRTWEAPAGTALLCSILLRPPAERRGAELSLLGGLAAAEAVEHVTGLAAQIKWPNDVMLNRRKVGGVLAETAGDGVVLGIGINVNQSRGELPVETRVPAGSLYTTDSIRRERAPLLADLLVRLETAYRRWKLAGLDAVYDALGSRDFLRGRIVYADGTQGVGVGIDRSGRFEVAFPGGRRFVESGEIAFER